MKQDYTGRKIAIFTDAHALLEPLEAVLLDIRKKDIKEIYSLGDNIGLGPNPKKVMDILNEYNIVSLAGNNEYYLSLGVEPFQSYFDYYREAGLKWTKERLDGKYFHQLSLYPSFIDLIVGDKKVGLCHFANDVRFDFHKQNSWTYQDALKNNLEGYKQFLYTNSKEQLEDIKNMITRYGKDNPIVYGYVSALGNPLFNQKPVTYYDAIIQGHVHFKLYEESDKTKFYTIRALGIGYQNNDIDLASYIILHEKKNNGFDLEEVLVKYDREKMVHSIISSSCPQKTIEKYTNISRFTK